MSDDVFFRQAEGSAAAEPSHGAEWSARPAAAPLNTMGANVTIQKNWQELIRPNKLQVTPGVDDQHDQVVTELRQYLPASTTGRGGTLRRDCDSLKSLNATRHGREDGCALSAHGQPV